MSGLVKLACPQCGSVYFEPETPSFACLHCRHAAPIAAWKAARAASRKRPDFWVVIAAANVRNRRLEADKRRMRSTIQSYGGGFCA
jgi:hypothetical protein